MSTNIEWTDVTDNIIVALIGGWWCRMKNLLCANCYAATINLNSFFGGNKLKYSGKPPELVLKREIIEGWKRQRKPRKHFVASMTDVFGEWVSRAWQFEFLDGMLAAPLQTFQLLTKRPAVMLKAVKYWMAARGIETPPHNIWLGFSAGTQETFDEAWPYMKQLAEMGCTVFVSLEPLIGPVTLPDDFLAFGKRVQVITGGESGKKKQKVRPSHPEWFMSLRDQCVAAGVPFFFKQWGEYASYTYGYLDADEILKHPHMTIDIDGRVLNDEDDDRRASLMVRVGKKRAGRVLQGRTWSQFPEVRA
jgi:protein gp37